MQEYTVRYKAEKKTGEEFIGAGEGFYLAKVINH